MVKQTFGIYWPIRVLIWFAIYKIFSIKKYCSRKKVCQIHCYADRSSRSILFFEVVQTINIFLMTLFSLRFPCTKISVCYCPLLFQPAAPDHNLRRRMVVTKTYSLHSLEAILTVNKAKRTGSCHAWYSVNSLAIGYLIMARFTFSV